MKITFFSNFLVPHQVAFCKEMGALPGVEFTFVAAQPFDAGKVTKGFSDLNTEYAFCLPACRSEADRQKAEALCRESDVVLMGAAPESWFRMRMAAGGLTFRVSERLFKPQYHTKKDIVALACTFKGNTIYARRPLYLLAAGAYTAADYAYCGAFRKKAYQWGYFPAGSEKSWETLAAAKAQNAVPQVLWAGRMIGWKHAEAALAAAKHCKEAGLAFTMQMLGDGPEEENLRRICTQYDLDGCVRFGGAVPNEAALAAMEQADIFLATSDENEGWGAVVNEAMSAGCTVIASRQMGSVPYLIENGKNGFACPQAGDSAFGAALETALRDAALRRRCGAAAKQTVTRRWSAHAAAQNLYALCCALLSGEDAFPIAEGPCAKAEILR
ncbi:MAG: glycosyltransferase [Faecalibacterium sp.]|jgi:glycosyltransferase involved in cell wall biosynthesis|nr:glycosyltransferase [Faecalibacterium sp.]